MYTLLHPNTYIQGQADHCQAKRPGGEMKDVYGSLLQLCFTCCVHHQSDRKAFKYIMFTKVQVTSELLDSTVTSLNPGGDQQ